MPEHVIDHTFNELMGLYDFYMDQGHFDVAVQLWDEAWLVIHRAKEVACSQTET